MKIAATIGGFTGNPVTLAANYDEPTGVLTVAKAIKFREERPQPDMAMVTNLKLKDLDFEFTADHMQAAIVSFYARKAQGTLQLLGDVGRYDPAHKIERDKIEESGQKYRISPDADNGAIAVLALVAFVDRQNGYSAAMAGAAELGEIYKAFTI